MDVWQRGTSGLAVGATTVFAYAADGWMVAGTYSSGSGPVVSQAGGRLLTKNSLQITGATNCTDVKIKQRIESLIAAAFCSQQVTVSAQVYNNTGGSITPTLTVNRPSAQDNYTSVTADVNAVNLQACPNGAWTQIAYTFAANAASYNGLEILFDFGNNFSASTKDIQIAEFDIRVTPGASTGLNSSPPPPELRPIAIELPFCLRYLQYISPGSAGNTYFPIGFGAAYSTSDALIAMAMSVPMRATPAIAVPSGTFSTYFQTIPSATVTGLTAAAGFPTVNNGPGPFIALTLAGTFTAGLVYLLQTTSSTSAFVSASAEL